MGTGDEGSLKLATGGILTYSAATGIGVDGVISLAETLRGDLYFNGRRESERFRVGLRTGDSFQAVAPRVPPSVTYFGWRPAQVLLQDHAGEWWLASSQGLVRYPRLDSPLQLASTAPKAVYTMRDGLPGNVVVRLHEDGGGNIWIGTETRRIGFWSSKTQRFISIPADGAPGFASAFAEDHTGNMWIGDEDGQLWRVRDGRALRIASPADGRHSCITGGSRRTSLGCYWRPGTAAILTTLRGARPASHSAYRLFRRAFQPQSLQSRRGPERVFFT